MNCPETVLILIYFSSYWLPCIITKLSLLWHNLHKSLTCTPIPKNTDSLLIVYAGLYEKNLKTIKQSGKLHI